jgi:DNA polymerase IV (DinB-like DNA polymerase)
MLVDFDYFFAQCEELRNPVLTDRPVVIGVYSGRTEDSGAVSTANYIARKY